MRMPEDGERTRMRMLKMRGALGVHMLEDQCRGRRPGCACSGLFSTIVKPKTDLTVDMLTL